MKSQLVGPSALVLFAVACSDYTLTELDDKPTYDTGTAVEAVPTEECGALNTMGQQDDPGLGWEDEEVCAGYHYDGVSFGPVGVRTLTSFRIDGTETSPTPPDHVRIVAQVLEDDGSVSYPPEDNLRSDNDLSASEASGDWYLDTTGVSSLNSCYPLCEWGEVMVEIQDEDRTIANECSDYLPKVDLCLYFTEAAGTRSVPAESDCTAGSGNFRLVPRRMINHDGDSNFSLILTPIQLTGTGVMTGAAWITELDIIEDQEQSFRIIKPNATFRFDEDDELVDANMVSIALLDQNDWSTGVVSGGAPIVAEELAGTVDADFRASIEWSCGTVPPAGQRNPPQGYVVDMDDLDCTGSWKQKFTIRPVPYASPTRLHIERYGHVEDREMAILRSTGNGYAFQLRRGEFNIRGVLSSYNSQGATLVLNELSVDGQNVCDTGTYSLPVE